LIRGENIGVVELYGAKLVGAELRSGEIGDHRALEGREGS